MRACVRAVRAVRCARVPRTYCSAPDTPSGVRVEWRLKDGSQRTTYDPPGTTLLEAAHHHGIDLEGACDQSLACSTCHVILEDRAVFDALPEPCDEENDMLDLAFGLTETSRLGCQVVLSPALDGLRVRLPAATRNMMVDGHVPKPH